MDGRKDKSAAKVTIEGPGLMSEEGRKNIAAWLRKLARDFERYGHDYSNGRFTARYFYKQS